MPRQMVSFKNEKELEKTNEKIKNVEIEINDPEVENLPL